VRLMAKEKEGCAKRERDNQERSDGMRRGGCRVELGGNPG